MSVVRLQQFLQRMVEYQCALTIGKSNQEEVEMKVLKDVLSKIKKPYDGYCIGVYYVSKKELMTEVYCYSSCRGFLHDALSGDKYKALASSKRRSMYLVSASRERLNEHSFKLTKEFCEWCGYREPKMLEVRDGAIVFQLDMRLFKNLYAVSFLFLLFRRALVTVKATSFKNFIERHWKETKVQERAMKALDNWSEIFQPKQCGWASMYGYDEIGSHHGEGVTELLQGKSGFPFVKKRANKILGGVGKERTVVVPPYSFREIRNDGPVGDLKFTQKNAG